MQLLHVPLELLLLADQIARLRQDGLLGALRVLAQRRLLPLEVTLL